MTTQADRLDALVNWLRSSGDLTTEEDLRARALTAGHTPADVDAALERWRVEKQAVPPPAPTPPVAATSR